VEVYCLAFSPGDGRWLATGNVKGDVLIRDAITGKRLHTLTDHAAGVSSVAFSLDGRLPVSLSREGKVRVYDAAHLAEERPPQLLLAFTANQSSARGTLAFSPDGKGLVVPGDDNTVNIWDLPLNDTREPGAPRLTLRGHKAQVWAVTFSPDGRWVASGSEDSTVKLWDAAIGGKPVRTFRGHSALVSRVVFSPDGKRLASASFDKTVRVWDTTRRVDAPQQ
jgi:WD40 repeat protein